MPIKGLHHSAYRCRDSEATRAFYEDFLGLPLVATLQIGVTKTGRETNTLHTFFRMGDGSCLAFFEAPDMPFDFKPQHDYDLHVALEVDRGMLQSMLDKGRAAGLDTRGVADHGLFDSIYLRDPNGYVVELACPRDSQRDGMDPARNGARATLDRWTSAKADSTRWAQPDRG